MSNKKNCEWKIQKVNICGNDHYKHSCGHGYNNLFKHNGSNSNINNNRQRKINR